MKIKLDGENHLKKVCCIKLKIDWTDDPIKQKQVENLFEGLNIEQLERFAEFGE